MASIHNEDQNCTDVDTLMKEYYLPVTYSIIFIVGLVGNATSISVYLTKLRPWKSSSIIMVNLALTDLFYVLSLPFLVYYYSNGDSWMLGDFMCRFVRFGFHFNLYGSILFLTCLAVFRYIVVMNPLRTAQVQQKRWGIVACSAVWIIAAAEITPMLTLITMEEQNNKTYCLDFASTPRVDDILWYNWLLTVLGFILPLLVVFMCYIGVVKKLAKGPKTTSLCRMRARRMTVLILVVFVVCYLPFHIMRVLRIQTRNMQELSCMMDNVVNAVYIISRPLAGLNTFFNLALYTLSGDMFREAFLSIFYWKCCLTKTRSQLQLAIISNTGSDTPAV
ncbi:2-oxoglutarate receptor 1 Alpha-ketoglutarate receptor 1 [Channa argus]|uniref:2-oxoglutarate receptor 1 Alpha-ketoglutarate receptor 1 n=1 Tax=Channa argus TaxID=215402 RepID=A0A6G1QVM1_CHAAH|nr:2-oxoglutarate receptor 1 Alpha-ketoglutarate receptor 1 [Channa argus]